MLFDQLVVADLQYFFDDQSLLLGHFLFAPAQICLKEILGIVQQLVEEQIDHVQVVLNKFRQAELLLAGYEELPLVFGELGVFFQPVHFQSDVDLVDDHHLILGQEEHDAEVQLLFDGNRCLFVYIVKHLGYSINEHGFVPFVENPITDLQYNHLVKLILLALRKELVVLLVICVVLRHIRLVLLESELVIVGLLALNF